ncbi:hypothetical protein C8R47DRAFT_1160553 [Mycena vitilis]|nr:hypothetical protein C8R47DRAFT_1160553 [Mycena vitilis]
MGSEHKQGQSPSFFGFLPCVNSVSPLFLVLNHAWIWKDSGRIHGSWDWFLEKARHLLDRYRLKQEADGQTCHRVRGDAQTDDIQQTAPDKVGSTSPVGLRVSRVCELPVWICCSLGDWRGWYGSLKPGWIRRASCCKRSLCIFIFQYFPSIFRSL